MLKNNDQKVVFDGKNFAKVLEKLPLTGGRLFVVGCKNETRVPISMFEVRNKRIGRKETIKGKFLKKIDNMALGRKDYLLKLITENEFENLIIEWD